MPHVPVICTQWPLQQAGCMLCNLHTIDEWLDIQLASKVPCNDLCQLITCLLHILQYLRSKQDVLGCPVVSSLNGRVALGTTLEVSHCGQSTWNIDVLWSCMFQAGSAPLYGRNGRQFAPVPSPPSQPPLERPLLLEASSTTLSFQPRKPESIQRVSNGFMSCCWLVHIEPTRVVPIPAAVGRMLDCWQGNVLLNNLLQAGLDCWPDAIHSEYNHVLQACNRKA